MKIRLKELNTGYYIEKSVSRLSPKQRAVSVIALALVAVFLITFIFSVVGILPLDAISARISTGLSNEKSMRSLFASGYVCIFFCALAIVAIRHTVSINNSRFISCFITLFLTLLPIAPLWCRCLCCSFCSSLQAYAA
mgnify:CR=1 FL=1